VVAQREPDFARQLDRRCVDRDEQPSKHQPMPRALRLGGGRLGIAQGTERGTGGEPIEDVLLGRVEIGQQRLELVSIRQDLRH